jgi:hypothetical protein
MWLEQVGHPSAATALTHGFRVEVNGIKGVVRVRARVSEEVAERVGLSRRAVARGHAPSTKPCGYAIVRLRFRPRARRLLRDESPLVLTTNLSPLQKLRFR